MKNDITSDLSLRIVKESSLEETTPKRNTIDESCVHEYYSIKSQNNDHLCCLDKHCGFLQNLSERLDWTIDASSREENLLPSTLQDIHHHTANTLFFRLNCPFAINPLPRGTGKTYSMIDHINITKKTVAVVSSEHQHIEDELAKETDILHRKGLIKFLKDDDEITEEEVNEAEGIIDLNVSKKTASEIIYSDEKDDDDEKDSNNPYLAQFDHEGNVGDPIEFTRLPHYKHTDEGPPNYDEILLDESPVGKTEEKVFTVTKNLIANKKWRDEVASEYIENPDHQETLEETLRILDSVINRLPSLTDKYDSLTSLLAEYYGWYEQAEREDLEALRVMWVTDAFQPSAFEDMRLLSKLEHLENRHHVPFTSKLEDWILKAYKDENNTLAKKLSRIKESLQVLLDTDSKIIRKEIIYEADGKLQSDSWNTVLFEDWGHSLFRIFDLVREHGMALRWTWASFLPQYVDLMIEQYDRRKKRKERISRAKRSIKPLFNPKSPLQGNRERVEERFYERLPERLQTDDYSFDVQVYSPEIGIETLKDYKSRLIHLRRKNNATTSRRKILKNGEVQDVLDKISPFLDKDTGIISYKQLIDRDGQSQIIDYLRDRLDDDILENLEDNLLYFDGGGVEGSNELKDCEKLILIGAPFKHPKAFIKPYYSLFGAFPDFEQQEKGPIPRLKADPRTRRRSRIGFKDEKIDFVHNLIVRQHYIDNIHRLRGLREEEKDVWVIGPAYEELKNEFESKRLVNFIVSEIDTLDHDIKPGKALDEIPIDRDILERYLDEKNYRKENGIIRQPAREQQKEDTRTRIREGIRSVLEQRDQIGRTELYNHDEVQGNEATIREVLNKMIEEGLVEEQTRNLESSPAVKKILKPA